jgi:hypothetical protein
MRIILWLSLSMMLMAQRDTIQLATGGPAGEDHPQLLELLKIKRLHVDRLAGGDTAVQIRDMLIGQLQASRLFIVTENPERADTFLRGSAEDLIFTEAFSSNESLTARSQLGSARNSGTTRPGLGFTVGEQESLRTTERKHEAMAAVRLVNKEGDVIWSTIQESTGAKFQGASADVASKVTRVLMDDFARARKLSQRSGSSSSGQ